MKKAFALLLVTTSIHTVSAHQGLEGLKKGNVHIHNFVPQHEQQRDEYEYIDECEYIEENDTIEEYESYVCDHVKPPKISAAMALFTEIGGNMLIKFITIKEAFRRYLLALKMTINKWLGYTVTQ